MINTPNQQISAELKRTHNDMKNDMFMMNLPPPQCAANPGSIHADVKNKIRQDEEAHRRVLLHHPTQYLEHVPPLARSPLDELQDRGKKIHC